MSRLTRHGSRLRFTLEPNNTSLIHGIHFSATTKSWLCLKPPGSWLFRDPKKSKEWRTVTVRDTGRLSDSLRRFSQSFDPGHDQLSACVGWRLTIVGGVREGLLACRLGR